MEAVLNRIPVFVKAGSIIPMECGMQYAQEEVETPLELHVYPGADAAFTLYEDDGDGYGYEEGSYQTVLMEWNDREWKLTIGAADVKYPQGILGRNCQIIINDEQRLLKYEGKEVSV